MILRKSSEHGLGCFLNPLDPNSESTEWIDPIWDQIVRMALGLPVQRPDWFALPAVGRETATSPNLLKRLSSKHQRRRVNATERIRPMNFLH